LKKSPQREWRKIQKADGFGPYPGGRGEGGLEKTNKRLKEGKWGEWASVKKLELEGQQFVGLFAARGENGKEAE